MILSVLKKLVWILLVFTSAAYAQKENKYIRNGNNEYEEKNYKEAEVDYMKALEKSPESYKGQYNLGGALYKQENYEDATKLYNNLTARETGKDARADAWYNLGNSLLKSEKYAESVEAYKNALRNNPDDLDAKYNLAYAMKKLQQQQQEQQNKEQDQNEDQQQDQKDQQKQDQQEQEQDQKDQQQQNQEQNQQQQEKQQQNSQQQQQPQQISKQDAERMLQALKNDENKTLEKVRIQQMQATRAKKVEKDW
ncbi:MAG: tetratricopeptide repeat protein [Bacteroidales bacterium]|nr:tetratricopeptide repeat protein [Bacteroidales bacterium]